MSLHRTILVAVATLATGLSSAAFANCCGYAAPAPTYYAPPSPCGGCGGGVAAYAPTTYATPIAQAPLAVGCGGCGTPAAVATYAPAWGTGCGSCGTPSAAVTFAAPVAPTPTWGANWGTGCGGCGVATQPAPLYVVNQGPEYTGPGIMVPYRTWARPAAYSPYGPGYGRWHRGYGGRGYGYGQRFGYRAHAAFGGHYMIRGTYHPGHSWHG
jgi:hypothetical protein